MIKNLAPVIFLVIALSQLGAMESSTNPGHELGISKPDENNMTYLNLMWKKFSGWFPFSSSNKHEQQPSAASTQGDNIDQSASHSPGKNSPNNDNNSQNKNDQGTSASNSKGAEQSATNKRNIDGHDQQKRSLETSAGNIKKENDSQNKKDR